MMNILTIMGTKIDEGSENYKEVMNAFNILAHRTAQNSVYSSVGLGFLTLTPEYKKTLKYLRELVCDLIKKNPSLKAESDEYEDGKQALVNLAVKAMKQGLFTASDVEIESFTMIAASYETSAIVVYSALVLLAMHPEIQERAFEEVRSVFPDGITSVEYDDLKKFPYLDMVIAEALRLAPPIPYIGRQAINETELRPGVTIPKEMQVIIPIFELHRRKELWGPEAARFNPENFLPGNIAKRHPCAYMAFSKGPRNCIGVRYAEFTLHVLLITLLRSLKFSTTFKYDDIVFMPNVTLSYKVEPLLSIEVRA
ncbi:probable cytochrome P450 313a4 [Rhagoletis pomonella]|uniref:probable cytochrome P450 313a4 n=1 Tax=Rhagoletis pomonella TaxID=28610 RepID=UPI001781E294|nr:probable cytochrome P450 313a4 [Rhagoletis pomonella]